MNVNAANSYSVGNGEKAAAAHRAADVRKRLLKSAGAVEEAATPEETALIGRWLNAQPGRSGSDDEYHAAASGRDSDFG
jgi:hypothetical protein